MYVRLSRYIALKIPPTWFDPLVPANPVRSLWAERGKLEAPWLSVPELAVSARLVLAMETYADMKHSKEAALAYHASMPTAAAIVPGPSHGILAIFCRRGSPSFADCAFRRPKRLLSRARRCVEE